MFRNLFKSAVCRHFERNFIQNSALFMRYSSENTTAGNTNLQAQNQQRDDLKSAMDIESQLFDQSTIQHSPVSTREVLRQNRIPQIRTKPKPKAKSIPISAPVENSTQIKPSNKFRISKEPPPVIQDPELGLDFIRLRLDDAITSTLMTVARSRKRRDKDGDIIVEGRRLIAEALECGLRMHTLLFSQRDQLKLLADECQKAQQKFQTKIYKVPQHNLKTWSTLTTPPGLLALFERPSNKGIELKQNEGTQSLPITVVCDNIREPNNLGSIIRTCAALPCQQVIVTRGCCDPWESKALRGGCGGHFRLPIKDNVNWDDLSMHIPPDLADDCYVFVAENNLDKLADKNCTIDYSEVANIGAHNVLIIGGETHGVSENAYNFMELVGQQRGKCIYIPLARGVDSLNVASALTLILFELRKILNSKEIL